jgi:hypothetical protein
MRAEDFIHGLNGVRKNGKGWSACCPAHDDRKASLHVSDGEKGVILKCFTGCDAKDIAAAKGLELKDLFFVQSSPKEWLSFPIKTVNGELVAVRKRRGSGKKKELLWESPNGKPDLGGLKTCDLPLYGSEHIKTFDRSRWIELGEGEAKTQALQAIGAQALGTSTGASSTPSEQVLASLQGFKVRLWPDNDDPGRQHMSRIADELRELGIEYVTLNTRSLPPKGDAVQWIEAQLLTGTTKEQLRNILKNDAVLPGLPREEGVQEKTISAVVDVEDFLLEPIPERKHLLGPWLLEESLWIIHAKPGIGKTWFSLGVAHAVATGGEFLKWKASEPRTVLYVDGEMSRRDMLDRVKTITATSSLPLNRRLKLLCGSRLEGGEVPDLCEPEGKELIENNLEGVGLLVLDNLGCLFRSGVENDAESWTEAQQWLSKLRARGLAILLVHHSGKNGTQRGTSKREAAANGILKLIEPEDYHSEEEGCRFILECEKARDVVGADRPNLEASLIQNESGKTVWAWKDAKSFKRSQVMELFDGGLKVNQIARKLGLSHGWVSKLVKKNQNGSSTGSYVERSGSSGESKAVPSSGSSTGSSPTSRGTEEPGSHNPGQNGSIRDAVPGSSPYRGGEEPVPFPTSKQEPNRNHSGTGPQKSLINSASARNRTGTTQEPTQEPNRFLPPVPVNKGGTGPIPESMLETSRSVPVA